MKIRNRVNKTDRLNKYATNLKNWGDLKVFIRAQKRSVLPPQKHDLKITVEGRGIYNKS